MTGVAEAAGGELAEECGSNGDSFFDKTPEDSEEEDEESQQKLKQHLVYVNKKSKYTPINRNAIMALMRNCFCTHRLQEAAKMMKIVASDRRVSHDLVLRSAFILYGCMMSKYPEKEERLKRDLIQFVDLCTNLCLYKKEIFLDTTIFLLQIDPQKAKSFVQDHKTRFFRTPRTYSTTNKVIDPIAESYCNYVIFVDWYKSVLAMDQTIAPFNKMLKDQALRIIKLFRQILESSTNEIGGMDLFLHTVLKICQFYSIESEELEFFKKYLRANKNSLFAFHCLYQVIRSLPRYEQDNRLKKMCRNHIHKLSPSDPVILEVDKNDQDRSSTANVEEILKLMKFLEYRDNKENIRAWSALVDRVKCLQSVDPDEFVKLKNKYVENYGECWEKYHFNLRTLPHDTDCSNQLLSHKIVFTHIFEVCEMFQTTALPLLAPEERARVKNAIFPAERASAFYGKRATSPESGPSARKRLFT